MKMDFAKNGWVVRPVGSRVTCDPAPKDTDEDYLVFSVDELEAETHLTDQGFKLEGLPGFYTGNDNGRFRSYRRGELNVIVTPEFEFFERFMTATALAKRFNLARKEDRIALFQAILYGVGEGDLQS